MTRAYSYVRISSPNQSLGHGIARQLEASRRYAEEHNLELVEGDELRDIGVSAFKGANVAEGALGRFLQAVKVGKVEHGSTLIVESLDRISRQQVMKSMGLLIDIVNSGINVATLADGRTYTSGAGFEDMIYSIVALSRAHDESKTKSLRVSAAWANKRKNIATRKLTAWCPAWLVLSDDRKGFHVIQERVDLVHRIFTDTAEGIGAYTLTRMLNEAGISSLGGGSWHESSMNKLLTNRAVLGEFQPHRTMDGTRVADGEPIVGYFPRIVSDELFYRAQAARVERRTKGTGRKGEGVANLFSGLLKCAYCQSRMIFERKAYNYLTCYSAKRGLGCIGKRWRYEEFERQALTFIRELDLASMMRGDDDAKKHAALEGIVTSLKGEQAAIGQQMEKMIELLGMTTTSASFVAKKLEELEERRASVEKDLHEREQELMRAGSVDLEVQDIRELIDRIKDTRGEDAYKLRSMISARLRSVVDRILLAPAGGASLTRQVVELLQGQEQSEDVKAAIKHLAGVDPRRYFIVVLANGFKRLVYAGS
jgi:DNA invertase Pin-like site-specific DNA recombinase